MYGDFVAISGETGEIGHSGSNWRLLAAPGWIWRQARHEPEPIRVMTLAQDLLVSAESPLVAAAGVFGPDFSKAGVRE